MREFLNPNQGYKLVCYAIGETPIPENWVEVPNDADTFIELLHVKGSFCFFKTKGNLNVWVKTVNCWRELNNESVQDYLGDYTVLWERAECVKSNYESDFEIAKDNRVEYFEKFLNGEKIQYRIGSAVGNPESQWHNLTWNALKDMKHTLIEFRETPKYVTINGIEFKTTESLLKHVKNNYDLQS